MLGKVFVNYRRDDARDMAARIRDRLGTTFGDANVFMDVDNLLAGQRFDRELEKALGQTDVFLAVIGPRWLELLKERQASGERDYVREEVAGALQRGVVVIPVLIERTALPRADVLPDEIRDLALHQTHEVAHARFGRDVAELIEAIRLGRKAVRAEAGGGVSAIRWVGAVAMAALVLGGGVLAFQMVASDQSAAVKRHEDQVAKAKLDGAAEAARKKAEVDLLRPGRVFRDCPDCPEMVVVPAGSFLMGSPGSEEGRDADEAPRHRVTIARPFAAGKFEVTFAEWDACVAAGGCQHRPGDAGWGRGKRPVINVSWDDITNDYMPWLSRKTGKTYRLLTEAEWEYAARAGTTTPFSTGLTITTSQANFNADYTYGGSAKGTYRQRTVEVGSFPPNAFGLYDMHGNVSEWVQDCWNMNYSRAPSDGSAWTSGDCGRRVYRGGAWQQLPQYLRAASRSFSSGRRDDSGGFRVARTL